MTRPGPLDIVRAALANAEPGLLLEPWPRTYFRVGDVLLLPLPLPKPEDRVAEALARRLAMRAVLGVEGGIEGELRTPTVRLLWGDPDTRTTHTENGLRFRIDPARVMWSPGNLSERQRVARWDCSGETVVDFFAGVGYFSVPIAARGNAARIIACEKNPVSYAFLRENAQLNGVDARIETRLGDCRDVAPQGEADRVLLGYLPDSISFVGRAVEALRPEGGRLHVHRVVSARGGAQNRFAPVKEIVEAAGKSATLRSIHEVKSYGPGRVHVVLDVEVTR